MKKGKLLVIEGGWVAEKQPKSDFLKKISKVGNFSENREVLSTARKFETRFREYIITKSKNTRPCLVISRQEQI